MEKRIKQIIDYYGLNPYSMEQKICVSEGTISKFLAHKIGMKVPTLEKILENFPDVSSDWLLLGKGEMLRSDAQKTVSSSADSVPWSRYDAAQQEIGALRTRLEQSAESVARLLKENTELRKNPVSPSPATPGAPIYV